MVKKRILITGAGSGFGEGVALGLAKLGHEVIAGVQISPQVTPLKNKAESLGLDNLRVERLDILDPYDVKYAMTWDFDILLSNAGIGEGGPAFEIPMDLVRRNFETNVFAPLSFVQQFIAKLINGKRSGKIIFTSSMAGIFVPDGYGIYSATKHALEAIAEALAAELKKYNIQVQTINPGAYLTGFNETAAENCFRWLDDSKHFTKRKEYRAFFDNMLGTPQGRLDPKEMIEAMIDIIPSDTGKFRNVVPAFVEDMLKDYQSKIWNNAI